MKLYDLTVKSHFVSRWTGENVRGYRRTISQHHSEVFSIVLDLIRSKEKISDKINEKINNLEMDCKVDFWKFLSIHSMYHDISEVFTGDIPYPFKKAVPEFKILSDKFEENLLNSYDLNIDNISNVDLKNLVKILVKSADMIAVFRELKEYGDIETLDIMNEMCRNVMKKYQDWDKDFISELQIYLEKVFEIEIKVYGIKQKSFKL